jgi:hypothetical protein
MALYVRPTCPTTIIVTDHGMDAPILQGLEDRPIGRLAYAEPAALTGSDDGATACHKLLVVFIAFAHDSACESECFPPPELTQSVCRG